ncbi:MAG TPA: dTMP kinase [Alphaproteobacteria bacterium]|nr:dTMP kinase [Alphaproteobacteria bacterium]
MTQSRGVFITFEGGEGAGKSTQASLLATALEQKGYAVIKTREPGGVSIAERIRDILVNQPNPLNPISQLLLLNVARLEHLNNLIIPSIKQGKIVICDRFYDSTMAYQGYGQGISIEQIKLVHQFVSGSFMPDITFILDIGIEESVKRVINRSKISQKTISKDYFESLGRDFHQRVRNGFHQITQDNPHRCLLLKADVEANELHLTILSLLKEKLGLKVDDKKSTP